MSRFLVALLGYFAPLWHLAGNKIAHAGNRDHLSQLAFSACVGYPIGMVAYRHGYFYQAGNITRNDTIAPPAPLSRPKPQLCILDTISTYIPPADAIYTHFAKILPFHNANDRISINGAHCQPVEALD